MDVGGSLGLFFHHLVLYQVILSLSDILLSNILIGSMGNPIMERMIW